MKPEAPVQESPAAHGPVDMVWRVLGSLIAVWGGALLALIEVFLVPLRIGGIRWPVSPVLAVLSNIGLMLFARYVSGNRFVGLLPGFAWFAVTVLFSTTTAAGDVILLGNDAMPKILLLVGAASIAVGAFLCARPPRRPSS